MRGDQPWRGRWGVGPPDRGSARAGPLDGIAGTSQKRRAYPLPRPGRRCRGRRSGPAAQAGQAGGPAAAAGGGRGQTGPAVVTRADRRLVAAGLPFRSGDAGSHETIYLSLFVQSRGRCAASCSAACARVGRCATHGVSGCPRAVGSCATPFISASDPLRRPTGRCPGTGKAIWCLAGGPVQWGPWWSATAARCCCSPCPTGSPPSACALP
jgi:hypothetical protein